jgi:hypothetical protein
MFRYYRVILRELVINTLSSYTSISNAAVGNTIYNYVGSHMFYASSGTIVVENLTIKSLKHYNCLITVKWAKIIMLLQLS